MCSQALLIYHPAAAAAVPHSADVRGSNLWGEGVQPTLRFSNVVCTLRHGFVEVKITLEIVCVSCVFWGRFKGTVDSGGPIGRRGLAGRYLQTRITDHKNMQF